MDDELDKLSKLPVDASEKAVRIKRVIAKMREALQELDDLELSIAAAHQSAAISAAEIAII